jgi:hypothetical protein
MLSNKQQNKHLKKVQVRDILGTYGTKKKAEKF